MVPKWHYNVTMRKPKMRGKVNEAKLKRDLAKILRAKPKPMKRSAK